MFPMEPANSYWGLNELNGSRDKARSALVGYQGDSASTALEGAGTPPTPPTGSTYRFYLRRLTMTAKAQQDLSIPPPEALATVDDINTNLVFGRVVVPAPLNNKPVKKNMLGFNYAEHSFIGDAINLKLANGQEVPGIDHKFTLANGLSVTYGEINGLAGDFYATDKPISDVKDAQEQSKRFLAAYNTLADVSSFQPKEAQNILAVLQSEVDAVNDALHHGEDPSIAYNRLPDATLKLQKLTTSRPSGFPSYIGLARINWDHFGHDARTAYNAGHATALQTAANGDLEKAYTLNAFADHFLEDSFAAGHLRTPRKSLHKPNDPSADLCGKFMHDEDNAIGLSVKDPSGQSWTAYGDKRGLDEVATDHMKRCIAAVQASADEIYIAYSTQAVPLSDSYKAWTIAPTLESARSAQELAPLFKSKDGTQKIERRKLIKNRHLSQFTTNWWFWSTALECQNSGWWKYPITINGPLKILPYTSFAVTSPQVSDARLFYQSPLSSVLESVHTEGKWTGGVDLPSLWDAASFTPLAAVNWDNGNQIRVYYLSAEYKLQERCYADGKWLQGELNDMNIQAARNTSISAFQYDSGDGMHIRVYCQEEGYTQIKEFCNDGHWFRGAILPFAVRGTSIAAFAYKSGGWHHRLYYQAEDLSIREHVWSNNEWAAGAFDGGKAPGRTPIGALFGSWRGEVMDVYWMNTNLEITRSINIDGSWRTSKVVGPLMQGAKFALAPWGDGKHIRVYYQSTDNSVLEICSDDDGEWYPGGFVGEA